MENKVREKHEDNTRKCHTTSRKHNAIEAKPPTKRTNYDEIKPTPPKTKRCCSNSLSFFGFYPGGTSSFYAHSIFKPKPFMWNYKAKSPKVPLSSIHIGNPLSIKNIMKTNRYKIKIAPFIDRPLYFGIEHKRKVHQNLWYKVPNGQ